MEASWIGDDDATRWLNIGLQQVLGAEACRDEVEQLKKLTAASPKTTDPAYYVVRDHLSAMERRLRDLPHERKRMCQRLLELERECRSALGQANDRIEIEELASNSNQSLHNPDGMFVRHRIKLLRDEMYRVREALEMLQEAKRILDAVNV